jgi:capsular polysaccharide transport system permease protein
MALNIIDRLKGVSRLFLLCVVVPTAVSVLYFGFLATDVYISESQFVLRSPEKPAMSGIGMALAGAAGFAAGGNESFTAKAYVESRDALRSIEANGAFSKAFERDDIWVGERFGTLGFGKSFEALYKYYLNKVKVETDVTSSISILTVRAYTAADAHRINEQILRLSEETINRMNDRGRADMIKFALVEVDDAKKQSRRAGAALADFRNRRGVVDPEIQATAKLEMISKLQDQLITARTQLNQLRQFTPRNPQIPAVENRIRTLTSEIQDQSGSLTGSNRSLAANSAEYQRLFLENEFSDKQLAVALASLQEARNDARRQQTYVQRIVQPNLPDSPQEPRRWRGILSTLALGLLVWGIASMLLAGIKEHAQ